MSGVSVTFRNIYIKFQLFQINVAHCVQKMSNLTQLTASLTSKYNLHHAFGHAPRPHIILKLKATIFKENISNSNGVDTTSNNFSDNINREEYKVQSYEAFMSGDRDKTSKNNTTLSPLHPAQTENLLSLGRIIWKGPPENEFIIGAKLEAQDPLRSVNEWVNCEEMSPILIPLKCWRCFVQCFRFKDWKIRIV